MRGDGFKLQEAPPFLGYICSEAWSGAGGRRFGWAAPQDARALF